MRKIIKNSKGFTLLETIVVIAIVAILTAGTASLVNSIVRYSGTVKTLEIFKKIRKALETTYKENILYVENNCYGWTNAICRNIAILPNQDTSNTTNTTLLLNTMSPLAVQAWQDAGCTVTGTYPNLRVQCLDGYGGLLTVTVNNGHNVNSIYTNGYNKTPYTITFTSQVNTTVTDTWSSANLDAEYFVYSRQKLTDLASSLKSYHLSRLVHESAVNTCDSVNGGLDSYDDIIIPWYWQITGSNIHNECIGIEMGYCGCTSFSSTSVWPTSSTLASVDTENEFISILPRLGLNIKYRVDGFGNPIQLWFTVDSSNNLQGPPPRPRPNYVNAWAIKPPYRGIVGVLNNGTWIYYENIVYPQ